MGDVIETPAACWERGIGRGAGKRREKLPVKGHRKYLVVFHRETFTIRHPKVDLRPVTYCCGHPIQATGVPPQISTEGVGGIHEETIAIDGRCVSDGVIAAFAQSGDAMKQGQL